MGTRRASVLIVDDKPEGLLSLEAVLRASEDRYDVVTAASGPGAIAHVKETEFAVILLDVQMPGMDGFETARRIREISASVPIIFITAISHDEIHIFKGYDSGAVDYLFKPLNPHVLQSKVAIFVDLFYKKEALQEQSRILREQESQEHRRIYKNLADAIPHLIVKTDINGLADYFNRGWYDYTGLDLNQSHGRGWAVAFHVADFAKFLSVWREKTSGKQTFEGRVRIHRRADSSERWHLMRGVPQCSPSDELEGWLFTCTEIQEEMEIHFELEQRTRDLERSNGDLEQFAYVASHDLQEPLRKVRNYIDLVEIYSKGAVDQKTGQCLTAIVDGVKRMQQLIDDLLEYSRVSKSGTQTPEPVDVKKEVQAALEAIEGAHEATIHLQELPRVKGNAVQIRQLFQNLLANAVKFRNREPSQIWVGAEKKDDQWTFFVKDNGIGIPQDYTEKIFVIFHRLHTRDRYPGTGIGLAICKKIVETHGGRIWAESEVGKGTAFYFTLPVVEEESVVTR